MSIQITPNQIVRVTTIEETQRKLGRLVRLNRQVLDMTQTGLGARVGVKQSAICKFEKHGEVTFELFIKIAHGLNLPAWVLLKVAEDPGAFEQAFSFKLHDQWQDNAAKVSHSEEDLQQPQQYPHAAKL